MTKPVKFDQKALFKECRQLNKQQKHDDTRQHLFGALRRDQLDTGGVLQAGRMLERLNLVGHINVSIFGQFTTPWLAHALHASAMARGQALKIENQSYDNVMQGLMTLESHVEVVILLPWHQRLLAVGSRSAEQRIEEELNFWLQAWQLVNQKSNARIIQVGYDCTDAGASGQYIAGNNGGEIELVRSLNRQIREKLPDSSYFIDLEHVSGTMGRNNFYDARNYFWTKQPLSESGLVLLSRYLWAGIRATMIGPKKVLVLDLDNTLWGGVVGEVGAQGIELGDNPAGEAFKSFQQLAKQISHNGCLLAVCSKNNDADAREPFESNSDMVLSLSDFALFKASWEPKTKAIREISEKLNLGLDSFVFFDDSPTEQEEIRFTLPEVEVVKVPSDPSEYRGALLEGLWFESINITEADKQRGIQYQHERARVENRDMFSNIDDYLQSLEMRAEVAPLEQSDIERVVQLIGKTNQFNLTTRRHSRAEVLDLMAQPGTIALTLRLIDKFGEYGLCSVLLARADSENPSDTLIIDSWLMSCRVIGRTVEQFLFNQLLSEAKNRGFRQIRGEYVVTKKNSMVSDFFPALGFEPVDVSANQAQWFQLQIGQATEASTYVNCLSADD